MAYQRLGSGERLNYPGSMVTIIMAISGDDIRRRTGFERLLSWFDTDDEEVENRAAYRTVEDEFLY